MGQERLIIRDIDGSGTCGYLCEASTAKKNIEQWDHYYLRISQGTSSILNQKSTTGHWLMHTYTHYIIDLCAPKESYVNTRGARRYFRNRKLVKRYEFTATNDTKITLDNLPPLVLEWIQTTYTDYVNQQQTSSTTAATTKLYSNNAWTKGTNVPIIREPHHKVGLIAAYTNIETHDFSHHPIPLIFTTNNGSMYNGLKHS